MATNLKVNALYEISNSRTLNRNYLDFYSRVRKGDKIEIISINNQHYVCEVKFNKAKDKTLIGNIFIVDTVILETALETSSFE